MITKIQVETIKSMWVPPFSKEKEVEELNVKIGSFFHTDKTTKKLVFKLLDANANEIIIGYTTSYHIKNNSADLEEVIFDGKKALKLPVGQEVSFSHMWGDFGITKKITYLFPINSEE